MEINVQYLLHINIIKLMMMRRRPMKRMTMMLAVSGVQDLLTGSCRGKIDQIDQISFKRFD